MAQSVRISDLTQTINKKVKEEGLDFKGLTDDDVITYTLSVVRNRVTQREYNARKNNLFKIISSHAKNRNVSTFDLMQDESALAQIFGKQQK